jgi:hypothetical protein
VKDLAVLLKWYAKIKENKGTILKRVTKTASIGLT